MTMTRRASFAVVLIVPALLAVAALRSGAADEPSTPAAARAEGRDTGRYYEMRIYTAAPGKMDALHKRFRDHTLALFEKHGIKNVGYWTGVDEGQREKLYYVVAYPDRAAREQRLVNGIAKDPEFLKAVAESEKGGRLTSGIESILLAPTDYSPMR